MTNFEPDDQEEKPLDPAMENVRRKMVRLQIVSGAIMVVSLMAVFGAIVYKTSHSATKQEVAPTAGISVPADAPRAATAALPDGFSVQSVAFSGSQILFYGVLQGGQRKAIVFDIGVGRIVADVSVTGN